MDIFPVTHNNNNNKKKKKALCLTIARRQRHHGQSISRWSLYQARRLRTRLRKASLASQGSLLQTWHRLRLAVLHSIWTASQIAQASQPAQPSATSEPDVHLASSPSSHLASPPSSFASHHGHLARQLALKTIKAMIHNDWTKCKDNIRQVSGVCILASVTSPSGDVEGRLELRLHLSATCPVLCFFVCGLQGNCPPSVRS